jgi:hypothetical protein
LIVAGKIEPMQDTVWVALTTGVVTAATALAASWLTGQASVKAARVQVEAVADGQRRDRLHMSRRTAYAELLTYVTEVRWMAGDLIQRAAAGDNTALDTFRSTRRDVGRELARRRYLVFLEGPESIADAISRLQSAIDHLDDTLEAALGTQPDRVNELGLSAAGWIWYPIACIE